MLRLSCLCCCLVACLTRADYWEDRTRFIQKEQAMFLGAAVNLTEKEAVVNKILMVAKTREYLSSFAATNTTFPPARHFFEAKRDIEASDVFKFIQVMPKGAALHGHDFALVSTQYLLKNLTYREHLYACVSSADAVVLHFFRRPDASCKNWQAVADMRRAAKSVQHFDDWLERKLTLFVPNPKEIYTEMNEVWATFQQIFGAVVGLITYRPVFEDYIYQFLTEFYEDNVMYVEFRTVMAGVYDLDGHMLCAVETAQLYNDIVKRFKQNNPGFWGAKVIYAPSRQVDNVTVNNYLVEYVKMKAALPNFIAGFDLVGQEDKGEPISAFIDILLKFKEDGAHFFFHAGETNWQGTTDMNLIDAILLNTTRIGHGYAITKHPLALQLIKERGIAIEVNPISNQVLWLLGDLRNHPASILMADNYPLVIGSDDPSFWGAKGLSYDMYEAFMGLGGLQADLRTLKQLVLNSLQYSAMPDDEKTQAMFAWQLHWDEFLDVVTHTHNAAEPQSRNPTDKTNGVNLINFLEKNISVHMMRREVDRPIP